MKPSRFSNHARKRMEMRGATEVEITDAIQNEKWQPALQNKKQVRKKLDFGKQSPVNQQIYEFKTLQIIFAEEGDVMLL